MTSRGTISIGLPGTRPPRRPLPELSTASPRLLQLVHAHTESPAIVLDLVLDVLAANHLARALYSPLRGLDNLALTTFLGRRPAVSIHNGRETRTPSSRTCGMPLASSPITLD